MKAKAFRERVGVRSRTKYISQSREHMGQHQDQGYQYILRPRTYLNYKQPPKIPFSGLPSIDHSG